MDLRIIDFGVEEFQNAIETQLIHASDATIIGVGKRMGKAVNKL